MFVMETELPIPFALSGFVCENDPNLQVTALLLLLRRIIIIVRLKKRCNALNLVFAETLKKLREERGLSQKQLGQQMFVNHSTIARWESGSRLPDAAMILRLAKCLRVDTNSLLMLAAESDESLNVIIVDDSKVILTDSLAVLEEVIPNATITGFILPQEAIEFAKENRIALAFLDIELGTASGLDLCSTLHEINYLTNVVYLTAYPDYSLDAWDTEASGFMVKPLTAESVRKQLKKLRIPFHVGGADE